MYNYSHSYRMLMANNVSVMLYCFDSEDGKPAITMKRNLIFAKIKENRSEECRSFKALGVFRTSQEYDYLTCVCPSYIDRNFDDREPNFYVSLYWGIIIDFDDDYVYFGSGRWVGYTPRSDLENKFGASLIEYFISVSIRFNNSFKMVQDTQIWCANVIKILGSTKDVDSRSDVNIYECNKSSSSNEIEQIKCIQNDKLNIYESKSLNNNIIIPNEDHQKLDKLKDIYISNNISSNELSANTMNNDKCKFKKEMNETFMNHTRKLLDDMEKLDCQRVQQKNLSKRLSIESNNKRRRSLPKTINEDRMKFQNGFVCESFDEKHDNQTPNKYQSNVNKNCGTIPKYTSQYKNDNLNSKFTNIEKEYLVLDDDTVSSSIKEAVAFNDGSCLYSIDGIECTPDFHSTGVGFINYIPCKNEIGDLSFNDQDTNKKFEENKATSGHSTKMSSECGNCSLNKLELNSSEESHIIDDAIKLSKSVTDSYYCYRKQDDSLHSIGDFNKTAPVQRSMSTETNKSQLFRNLSTRLSVFNDKRKLKQENSLECSLS